MNFLSVLRLVIIACASLSAAVVHAGLSGRHDWHHREDPAQSPADSDAAPVLSPAKDASGDLTVAILDFDSSAGNPDLGKQISEALAATLSGAPGFKLVDRSTLARALQEHELNLTGLVAADQATKIGKLIGARIIITGRVFQLDSQLYLNAKIIGTETSLVSGVLVIGDKDAKTGDLLMKLSDEVAKKLRANGPELVAQPDAGKDPLPELKKAFAGSKLPAVSVQIQERHIASGPIARIDPAVETEIRSLFGECGFKVIDGDATQQAEAGVKLIVSGDAFSEFAAKIGNLVSCEARVEIKVTDRKSGEVLFSDSQTTRAVDLAENVAGKAALQKAGRIVGIRILQHLAQTMAEGKGKAQGKKEE